MLSPIPSPEAWISSLLASISHAGAAITIGLVIATAVLATRCKGRCREDETFRPHVV